MQKTIPQLTNNPVVNLALDTIKINKQALVFVNTKRGAEKSAEEIANKIKIKNVKLDELSEKILNVLSRPTKQCERLARCIKKGIAFHHAGLTSKQRELVENNFKDGLIKIIACTPTLAFGLDLPAFRTVIRDLKRYSRSGLNWIPVLEYLQMAGRSGRPKYDKAGEAIAIAQTESAKEEIWNKYIEGQPEDIYSKLAVEPVLRMYLLSLIAIEFVRDKKEIINFFGKTFWAHQYKDMFKLEEIIERTLMLLDKWGFISGKNDFTRASDIDSYRATILGKRVAELYIDPLTAYRLIKAVEGTKGKSVNIISFLQTVSHTIEIRPLLRVRKKEFDEIQQTIAKFESNLLESEPSVYELDYEDFINSVKTALFLKEWADEKDEEYLLEHYNVRPGELRIKLNIADWLLYAMSELARILKFQPIIKEIIKTRLRLRYGVKEELLPLLKLEGIGRVKARKMFNSGIKDIKEVRKADISLLSSLVGRKTALNVKKQISDK